MNNDYEFLYKLTFDGMDFHVDKMTVLEKRRVDVNEGMPLLSLIDTETGLYECYEYVCDDGHSYTTLVIGSRYYRGIGDNLVWICSSKGKCLEEIRRFIVSKIELRKWQIERANEDLGFWEKKLSIYGKD